MCNDADLTYSAGARRLVDAVQALSEARDVETVQAIVRTSARALAGSDGATLVLRDDDKCYYVDEDAIEPLWKGQRFPLQACISGWSMLNGQAVAIPDIYADDRIPHDAYRPTFVKSLVMVPIRESDPIGAIGNYWASHHVASSDEIALLQALANSTAVAMENITVHQELEARVVARTAALEDAKLVLEALSLSDDLTGLRNRRGFIVLAVQAAKMLQRMGRRGALVFLDVDGMKTLNDQAGHEAGDQLLRLVANGLAAACRGSDIVARLGGDEFVAFLADVDESVTTLVGRLRCTIEAEGRDANGDPPSVSIGVALLDPECGWDLEDLLAAADAAMYDDKQSRRRSRAVAS